jgi:hypothetical protein
MADLPARANIFYLIGFGGHPPGRAVSRRNGDSAARAGAMDLGRDRLRRTHLVRRDLRETCSGSR